MDTADTVLILTATVLVLFMTLPGLALFCGSIFGTLMIAVFGGATWAAQITGLLAVGIFTLVMAIAIALLVKQLVGVRVNEEAEFNGLDITSHGEKAYDRAS